ncbi:hypothetical protein H0H93_008068 [Arthromyces matolae]|nr:hypothetical protein H0H93_008068 [Arthromyces matolae]
MLFNLPRDAAVAYVLLAIIAGATPVPLMRNDAVVVPQLSSSLVDRDNIAMSSIALRSVNERDLDAWEDNIPNRRRSMDTNGGFTELNIRSGLPTDRPREFDAHGLSDAYNRGNFNDVVDNVLDFIRSVADGPAIPRPHPSPPHARSPSPASSRPSSSGSGSSGSSDGMSQHWGTIDRAGAEMDAWKPKIEKAQEDVFKALAALLKYQATTTLSQDEQRKFDEELKISKSDAKKIIDDKDSIGDSLRTAANHHFQILGQLKYSPAAAPNAEELAKLQQAKRGSQKVLNDFLQGTHHSQKQYMDAWRVVVTTMTKGITSAEYNGQDRTMRELVKGQIKYLESVVKQRGIPEELKQTASVDLQRYKNMDRDLTRGA